MRLTNEGRKLLNIKSNVTYAEPLFNFKRRQNEMAKLYKSGKYKSEQV